MTANGRGANPAFLTIQAKAPRRSPVCRALIAVEPVEVKGSAQRHSWLIDEQLVECRLSPSCLQDDQAPKAVFEGGGSPGVLRDGDQISALIGDAVIWTRCGPLVARARRFMTWTVKCPARARASGR